MIGFVRGNADVIGEERELQTFGDEPLTGRGFPALGGLDSMSQRVERVAGEVRAVLGEVLARDEIKDPRVRGAGLITVTHMRVSGDLRHARVLFTVHSARRGGARARARGAGSRQRLLPPARSAAGCA